MGDTTPRLPVAPLALWCIIPVEARRMLRGKAEPMEVSLETP